MVAVSGSQTVNSNPTTMTSCRSAVTTTAAYASVAPEWYSGTKTKSTADRAAKTQWRGLARKFCQKESTTRSSAVIQISRLLFFNIGSGDEETNIACISKTRGIRSTKNLEFHSLRRYLPIRWLGYPAIRHPLEIAVDAAFKSAAYAVSLIPTLAGGDLGYYLGVAVAAYHGPPAVHCRELESVPMSSARECLWFVRRWFRWCVMWWRGADMEPKEYL